MKPESEDYNMKRLIVGLLIVVSMLLAACGVQAGGVAFTLDEDGNYTGFTDLPEDANAEDLEKVGYVVRQGIETIANDDVWQGFVEAAGKGEDAGVRIVNFYEEGAEGPYNTDLFFNNGQYYLFDSTAEEQTKEPFEFLLTLEGQFGNPKRDSGVVVLTNDDTLSFDEVMGSMLSSSMEYIQSVPPFRLVMFL